jgi:hypothetical protein
MYVGILTSLVILKMVTFEEKNFYKYVVKELPFLSHKFDQNSGAICPHFGRLVLV